MLSNELWQDALELSDDSDIEVHPNVDRRSFIRAKQSQIHMERQQRKLQIEAYKHQRIVNEALAQRLSLLISAIQSQNTASDADPSDIAFKAAVELALRNPEDDIPPPRPEGPPFPRYSKMIATVLDEANKALDRRHIKDRTLRFEALVEELGVHIRNIQDAQKDLATKLDELEQQSSKKITSDSYHVGFDTSHVSKPGSAEKKKLSSSSDTKVELLNPTLKSSASGQEELETGRGAATARSSADNNKSEEEEEEEEEVPCASPLAKRFSQLPPSSYRASHDFLTSHPELLHNPQEVDGLRLEAYTILLNDYDSNQAHERARQCTHQALVLQYCRLLGRDGVALFFKGMATPGHQAREVFEKDLAETFQRILGMARRDALKKRQDGGGGEMVERVQLCSLTEGEASVRIPPAESDAEDVQKARAIFEGFAPEMRAALETGSLEEVNKVLGEMEASEAEKLASLLTEVSFSRSYSTRGQDPLLTSCSFAPGVEQSGCMSIEEEIIDATTEDGKKVLEEMRRVGEVDQEAA